MCQTVIQSVPYHVPSSRRPDVRITVEVPKVTNTTAPTQPFSIQASSGTFVTSFGDLSQVSMGTVVVNSSEGPIGAQVRKSLDICCFLMTYRIEPCAESHSKEHRGPQYRILGGYPGNVHCYTKPLAEYSRKHRRVSQSPFFTPRVDQWQALSSTPNIP